MRHDWILDILADLQAYASANDLPELALKVAETLVVARREIAVPLDDGGDRGPGGYRSRRRVH